MIECDKFEQVVAWPAADPARRVHLASPEGATRGVTLCGLPIKPDTPPTETEGALCVFCERKADKIPEAN